MWLKGLVAQLCWTLCDPVNCSPSGSMGFSRQAYWSGCHPLLQGIFLTQGSNLGLSHLRQILYRLRHQGNPWKSEKARTLAKNWAEMPWGPPLQEPWGPLAKVEGREETQITAPSPLTISQNHVSELDHFPQVYSTDHWLHELLPE